MAGYRTDRVAEDIKREIVAMIRELKDPRVKDKMLTVVRVEVSSDCFWQDGVDYLGNSCIAYELDPVEDQDADWRLDVYTGSCRLPVLINEYLTACTDTVDAYHQDGIAAGFIGYPLEGFAGVPGQ